MSKKQFKSNVELLRRDPTHIQRIMVEEVENALGDEGGLFDTTTPLVHLMQMVAGCTAAFCDSAQVNARKQYPSLAMTPLDLYHHMADEDYVGRFAIPSKAPISILMRLEEVVARMVDTGVDNVKRLIIPAGSTVTVSDQDVFTFTHPVEIRKLAHGGLTCLYDNTDPSPFHDLTTNQVEWDITPIHDISQDERHGVDWLLLRLDLLQYETIRKIEPVTSSLNLSKTYSFENEFFYARVWNSVNGEWVEMATTHSDYNFDPLKPTAVLKVIGNNLEVTIPQVYITMGTISEEIMIDIYTTKGDINIDLSRYDSGEFVLELGGVSKELSKYAAPMAAIKERFVFSEGSTRGGKDGLSFIELRDRVMDNSIGAQDIPITTTQAAAKLSRMGYDIVTRVDIATRRVFSASRPLPQPTIGLLSPMNISVPRWTVNLDSLQNEPSVYYNDERVTITPKSLFKYTNGRVELVMNDEMTRINSLPMDLLIEHLTDNTYLYSPFYYVLDQSGDVFRSRVYDFGNPKFENVIFRTENDTLGVWASVQSRAIERTEDGWVIMIKTKSGEGFKELSDDDIVAQLAFMPKSESSRVYLNHSEIIRDSNKEIIFKFEIKTNYDVLEGDLLKITNFRMFDEGGRDQLSSLKNDYDFLIGVKNQRLPTQKETEVDQLLGHDILDGDYMGYYHETFKMYLGVPLTSIWSRSRPVTSHVEYKRYDRDIPLTYEDNIYERDEKGQLVYSMDNGVPKLRVIHKAGEVQKDSAGNVIMLHNKGDLVLADGAPIVVEDRSLLQELDLTLFDGLYWFATAQSDIDYRNSVADTMVKWITDDLDPIKDVLLDRTDIYFRPKETLGDIDVIIGENDKTRMRANRDIVVTYYITKTTHRDSRMREAIKDITSRVLSEALTKPVVTVSGIIRDLHAAVGNDAIEIKLDGFDNQPVITLRDDSSRLSVGKRPVALPDGTISVQESIQVNFILHTE